MVHVSLLRLALLFLLHIPLILNNVGLGFLNPLIVGAFLLRVTLCVEYHEGIFRIALLDSRFCVVLWVCAYDEHVVFLFFCYAG